MNARFRTNTGAVQTGAAFTLAVAVLCALTGLAQAQSKPAAAPSGQYAVFAKGRIDVNGGDRKSTRLNSSHG